MKEVILVGKVVGIVVLVLVLAGTAQAAAKPKPYAWTPTQALAQIRGSGIQPFGDAHFGNLVISKCAGKGKQVAKHYLSFACTAVWAEKNQPAKKITLFAKVRPVGKGTPCVSLTATVPAGCLAKGARSSGDSGDASVALAKKLGADLGTSFPYQGPMECASYGASYFSCWFGANGEPTDPGMGRATVILAAKPIINVIAMPNSG